jgi:ferric-dicitrate binding protein FerR (iron transport regulator)
MQKLIWGGVVLSAALGLSATASLADDWVVTKLRGSAAVLVGETWQPLHRGEVISDDRAVQTLAGGRMTLVRGEETIDLGPDTAIRIQDRDARQYTTVKQYFGTVAVEAEVQNVEHFAVETPHLAAVVKGTRFTVHSNETGAEVSVQRGRVAVEDTDTGESTVLEVGESVSTTSDGDGLDVAERTAPGNSAGKGKSDDAPGRAIATERSASAPGQSGERGNSDNSNAGGNGNSSGGNGNGGGRN